MKFAGGNHQHGQTLIEALVATGVVMMLVTGLVAGMTLAVKNSTSNKVRSMANKLTQEAIEIIRNKRDNGWNQFKIDYSAGSFCMVDADKKLVAKSSTPPYVNCDLTLNDGTYNINFTRQIDFTLNAGPPEVINAYVLVTWKEGANTRMSKSETQLTNWR
jgi:Tfp pilus assembly protein PilV